MRTTQHEMRISYGRLYICISYLYIYNFTGPLESKDFTASGRPKDI